MVAGPALDVQEEEVVELEWFDGHPLAVIVVYSWLDEEFVTSGVLVLMELVFQLIGLSYHPTCNHTLTWKNSYKVWSFGPSLSSWTSCSNGKHQA